MPLGKGLSSLIPKKINNEQPQPQAEDFATPKIPTAAPEPPALLEKNARPPASSLAGEVGRVSEAEAGMVSPDRSRGTSEAESQVASERLGERDRGFSKAKPPAHQDAIFQIEVDKIKPNPHQPRRNFDEAALKDLAASIQEFGIIQPLVVSKIEKENEMGTSVEYELIAGERRLMAVKMLGWQRVPSIIRKISQKSEQLELAVIENLQRENLNPVETARAYAKLQDEFGITQREIAQRLGKSRETISNTLRLLNLPTEIQDAVSKNQINESQARLLLAIEDPLAQKTLFNELLNNNLSVRELRQKISGKQNSTRNKRQETSTDPETNMLQEKLIELLSAPVKIEKTGSGGKIIITYYSPEEINGIIDKINSQPQTSL